jgi:hypothetical protein
MKLPVRSCITHRPAPALALAAAELEADPERQTDGLPWVSGTFDRSAPTRLSILVRMHNRAGIPIVEGRCELEANTRQFTVRALSPLGIEAYAHASESQRLEVRRRVWSRCAFCTLEVRPGVC